MAAPAAAGSLGVAERRVMRSRQRLRLALAATDAPGASAPMAWQTARAVLRPAADLHPAGLLLAALLAGALLWRLGAGRRALGALWRLGAAPALLAALPTLLPALLHAVTDPARPRAPPRPTRGRPDR